MNAMQAMAYKLAMLDAGAWRSVCAKMRWYLSDTLVPLPPPPELMKYLAGRRMPRSEWEILRHHTNALRRRAASANKRRVKREELLAFREYRRVYMQSYRKRKRVENRRIPDINN